MSELSAKCSPRLTRSSRPLSTVFQNIHPPNIWRHRKGTASFTQVKGQNAPLRIHQLSLVVISKKRWRCFAGNRVRGRLHQWDSAAEQDKQKELEKTVVPAERQGALHLPSPRGEGKHAIPFDLHSTQWHAEVFMHIVYI